MEEFPCPKCRSLNEKSAVFCSQCGCNIEAVKRRKKIFKIAFFVIFLALLTTGAICAIVDYVDQKEHDEWWARKIYAIGHYDKIDDFNEGLAKVKLNGRYGFINEEYEEVIPVVYNACGDFSEGLAACVKNGKVGYVDKNGKIVVPFKYDEPTHLLDYYAQFYEGRAQVRLNGKFGFIDHLGNEVIPLIYDFAGIFSEGLAEVDKDCKVGFIDHLGNEVIPLIYDGATQFSDGLAGVKKGDSWGFINRYNEIVIPYKFREVKLFKNGECTVMTHDVDFRKIDKNGDFID